MLCDALAERGLWPFARYPFKPSIGREILQGIFGSIEWLLPPENLLRIPYSVAGAIGQLWHGNSYTFDTLEARPLTAEALAESMTRAMNATITISNEGTIAYRVEVTPRQPKPAPAPKSRRPAFIPVRRLDGRR